MGVDKANIRTVIHYDLPSSVEAFLQESGRAGRDRRPAQSVVLWNETDRIRETDPMRAAREAIMRGYLETGGCRRRYLMDALGSESTMCFGCDRCDGESVDGPVRSARLVMREAAVAALAVIRRHRRRRTADQIVGLLPLEWPASARQQLVSSLLASGSARIARRGPWKGLVSSRSAD